MRFSAAARALDEVLAGFTHDLAEAGAVVVDFHLDTRIERPGFDPFPQRKLDLGTCYASRPLIEFTVRQLVERLENVTIRQSCRVQEIVTAPGGNAVTGLHCVTSERGTDTLSADLVVDASGRGSLIRQLLKSIGHPLPAETSIGMDIGYSTALFAVPDDAPKDWKATALLPDAPGTSRGGFLLPCEGNRWIVTLAGMHGDNPPGDRQGIPRFRTEPADPNHPRRDCARRTGRRDPSVRNACEHASTFRAVRCIPARPASAWRCNLPLQSGLWSRHDRCVDRGIASKPVALAKGR
jgi:2-polyprenyl-6-methoxyphenol hydroxylase-like FAD-dependent oxidoreductase